MTERLSLNWGALRADEPPEVSSVLSVVIPVYNEAENLHPLFEEVTDVLLGLADPWEVIFVDDG